MKNNFSRVDWKSIEGFVSDGAKVLDLGCGDGELLELLRENKNITARGVEISGEKILGCIQKGISVFQSDLDEGLSDYGDKSFDYVILSLTLQVVYEPKMLIKEMLRVGKKAIVSIPNFGHWKMRSQLFFLGRAPKVFYLPYDWYDTPNIRTITVKGFIDLCKDLDVEIEQLTHTVMSPKGIKPFLAKVKPNLFSEISVFLIS